MALSGSAGQWRAQARLKLLLADAVRQGPFCLRFSHRAALSGALRVIADGGQAQSVLWEQRHGLDDGWHTENVDVDWSDRAPEAVRRAARFSHAIAETIRYNQKTNIRW